MGAVYTSEDIIEETNQLANDFYFVSNIGKDPIELKEKDFKFYKSEDNKDRLFWLMACLAQGRLNGYDIEKIETDLTKGISHLF